MLSVRLLWVFGMLSLVILTSYSVLTQSFGWLIFSFLYFYVTSFIGNTICYHRYLSHKTFKTTPAKHKILCIFNLLSGQGSPIIASAIHRHHHLYSDTEKDVHSIHDSILTVFFFSLKGSSYFVKGKQVKFTNELWKDDTLKFIHTHYAKLWALIIFVFALISVKFLVFVILAAIGWNAVYTNFCRTFLAHKKIIGSYRSFNTTDNSYNNMFLQIICLGEGLHNNHHMYPGRLNQAVLLSEFDPAAFVIEKFLENK